MSDLLVNTEMIPVKSKYYAEYRRFSFNPANFSSFNSFYELVEEIHGLCSLKFVISYSDNQKDILPINNDANYQRAVRVSSPLLRLLITRIGDSYCEINGYGHVPKKANPLRKGKNKAFLNGAITCSSPGISLPVDFHCISSILESETVKMNKDDCYYRKIQINRADGPNTPLGFNIRYVKRISEEDRPAVMISRLLPGGLAQATGILNVGDQIYEVNGQSVKNKSLYEVNQIIQENMECLILTVRPVQPKKVKFTRKSISENEDVVTYFGDYLT